MDKKKPYVTPTVTDHGSIVKQTQGIVSTNFETYGHRSSLDDPKNPNAD
jgi:hypothetical protein